MARQRPSHGPGGGRDNGGFLSKILRAIGLAPEEPTGRRHQCWEWEFKCWLEDENGDHVFGGTFQPVTDNRDDYQTAYMRSRREMWNDAVAAYPNKFRSPRQWKFHCRMQRQPRAVPC